MVNLILIKVNQIGLFIEIFQVIDLVGCFGYISVISYCSGEIEDIIIVDFFVVICVGQIKIGFFS